jgi:hypothetical protein
VLKFDLHGLVETRLRTFLEFTFAHIYHLRTKKYYACSHLEINVCTHSRKASDEPGERPNKIIMTEIAKQDTTDLLPGDVKSVRQGIYRRRRKTQPRLPKSREEMH